MLSVVTSPITTAALAANAQAVVDGVELPYIYSGAMNSVFGNCIKRIYLYSSISLQHY